MGTCLCFMCTQVDYVREVIDNCQKNLRAINTMFRDELKRPSFVEQVCLCACMCCVCGCGCVYVGVGVCVCVSVYIQQFMLALLPPCVCVCLCTSVCYAIIPLPMHKYIYFYVLHTYLHSPIECTEGLSSSVLVVC